MVYCLCVCVCVCVCAHVHMHIYFVYYYLFILAKCPLGQYLKNKQCKDCPKDFYQNEEGKDYCRPCPLGKITKNAKTDSIDKCFGMKDIVSTLVQSVLALTIYNIYSM